MRSVITLEELTSLDRTVFSHLGGEHVTDRHLRTKAGHEFVGATAMHSCARAHGGVRAPPSLCKHKSIGVVWVNYNGSCSAYIQGSCVVVRLLQWNAV